MKYDYFAFLKKEIFDTTTYNNFKNNDNLYFIHAKRDKLSDINPGKSGALYFNRKEYSLSNDYVSDVNINKIIFLKILSFQITLSFPFFTASENKFYSIQNPIAKERATGLPVLKGSSLKGALRQAAVDVVEDKLMQKYFREYIGLSDEQILEKESDNKNDKFFFKKRAQLVKLFGNEKDVAWFTFKTLLATGGIKDVDKIKEVLNKITSAFNYYLRKSKITDEDGNCKGRLIFEDLYFKKVALDVIAPLDRKKRTPVRGPIHYEGVPKDETITGRLIWFPFDLMAKGEFSKIESEWEKDKEIIKKAFERLSEKGVGAKTKDGWGRFKLEGVRWD